MFSKNKYKIIKNAIPIDVAHFVHDYFLLKKQVFKTLKQTTYISRFNNDWGVHYDSQCTRSYSHYSDIAMETILMLLKDKMETVTNLKLNPTYSYARIYEKGEILKNHKDRFSCEVSATLCLGGDKWSIFIKDLQGVKKEINLKPSDMLIYSGCELEHWRERFTGEQYVQVFLHYNDSSKEIGKNNIYDGRPHLGLPAYFKEKS